MACLFEASVPAAVFLYELLSFYQLVEAIGQRPQEKTEFIVSH